MTATVPNTNTCENKIPEVSRLDKKIDCDNKISDVDGKYFTTSNYEKNTEEILGAKIQERSYLIFLMS